MKTKRTPVHPAKPNHVGPVGRKMYVATAFLGDKTVRAFSTAEKRFKSSLTHVLVLPIDPANVERIENKLAAAIAFEFVGNWSGLDSRRIAQKAMLMLGLTPAKRKGRKAQ